MLTCLLCGVLDTVSVTRIKPSFMLRVVDHATHKHFPCWKTSFLWYNHSSSWGLQSWQSVCS